VSSQKALYQEVILDHNRKPRNYGHLADANRHAKGHNPLCGDQITLELKIDDDRIGAIAFEGEACAICKASASMMTSVVKGKRLEEAESLVEEFRRMATGQLDTETEAHHLGRLTVFSGIAGLPTRVKCAVLPWHTLHSAVTTGGAVSTEAGPDAL
jgi:nitrogen fixation NifU-like protein